MNSKIVSIIISIAVFVVIALLFMLKQSFGKNNLINQFFSGIAFENIVIVNKFVPSADEIMQQTRSKITISPITNKYVIDSYITRKFENQELNFRTSSFSNQDNSKAYAEVILNLKNNKSFGDLSNIKLTIFQTDKSDENYVKLDKNLYQTLDSYFKKNLEDPSNDLSTRAYTNWFADYTSSKGNDFLLISKKQLDDLSLTDIISRENIEFNHEVGKLGELIKSNQVLKNENIKFVNSYLPRDTFADNSYITILSNSDKLKVRDLVDNGVYQFPKNISDGLKGDLEGLAIQVKYTSKINAKNGEFYNSKVEMDINSDLATFKILYGENIYTDITTPYPAFTLDQLEANYKKYTSAIAEEKMKLLLRIPFMLKGLDVSNLSKATILEDREYKSYGYSTDPENLVTRHYRKEEVEFVFVNQSEAENFKNIVSTNLKKLGFFKPPYKGWEDIDFYYESSYLVNVRVYKVDKSTNYKVVITSEDYVD